MLEAMMSVGLGVAGVIGGLSDGRLRPAGVAALGACAVPAVGVWALFAFC